MPLFTRITLNPVNPDVRKVLRSPEAIHAVVSAATSGSSRPLWRLDGDRLYIVSDQLDTDRLEARLGKPIINTLDYRPFLDKLQNGETRRFTLTATPVVSKNGKRTPLRTPAEMHQWAEGKLTQAGARLDALDILDVHATRFNRQGRKLTFHTVEYTGEITITDRDKLTQTMLSGIGHGKAYGLGLMLLFLTTDCDSRKKSYGKPFIQPRHRTMGPRTRKRQARVLLSGNPVRSADLYPTTGYSRPVGTSQHHATAARHHVRGTSGRILVPGGGKTHHGSRA
ncbi:hypothetical protein MCC01972_12830 [Bifidobacteriaceae bacterium MCC01972]|nr:hypothetical protein MCC01972_12830 [Bifidobacteriaceae bacterium MCC01972]GDZ00508.1 hypothetical protein MCC01975_18390 [Bifidobacteriaceae bacterium MCC01975]